MDGETTSTDGGGWTAVHHPFTGPKPEFAHTFAKDPASALAYAYDIVLNGTELGGGSIRIHDREMQKDVFTVIGLSDEEAASKFLTLGINVFIPRVGVVLTKKGGALEKMKTPVITPLGSGKQNLPWIHIDDLCEMYLKAIENNLTGIYNAVAPEHQTSYSFSKELAKSVQKPFVDFPVPSFVLKIMFGEMAIILLEGSRISAKKIEKTGFSFRFDTLEKALKSL